KGLGKILSEKMLSVARDMYLKRIRMHILKENEKMLTLAQKLGFKPVDLEEDIVRVEKILN
ncbi:GNAT family N-acetyltransferase, partial [Thermosulfurimonas dismutans]